MVLVTVWAITVLAGWKIGLTESICALYILTLAVDKITLVAIVYSES
jgi:hypothetical protein